MKSKPVNSHRLILFIAVLAVIIGVASVLYIILYTDSKQVTPEKQAKQHTQQLSFAVDASKASDWWTSGTLYSRESVTDDYIGDVSELPVADIIIHHGKMMTNPAEDNCFVSLSYFDTPLNRTAELTKITDLSHGDSGLTMKQVGEQSITGHTFEGDKAYQVSHYEIIGASSEEILRGSAVGFIEMKDGYVSVRANCKKPSQLKQVASVLQAVKLVKEQAI